MERVACGGREEGVWRWNRGNQVVKNLLSHVKDIGFWI